MHWWSVVFAVVFGTNICCESRRYHPRVDANGAAGQDVLFLQAQQKEGQQTKGQQQEADRHHNNIVVDESTGIRYNPYSKHHPGRHVCTSARNVSHPIRLTKQQATCKPTYKKYYVRCGNQLCVGVRLVYETSHKDVVSTRSGNETPHHYCCPGWTQVTNRSHGCNKPFCPKPCLNGGKCVKPGMCSCPRGFTGTSCELPSYNPPFCRNPCLNGGTCVPDKGICACIKGFRGSSCEKDIDECKEYKPCDQICHNTPGSYSCQCRENFQLQNDGQSCRKEDDGETTIEAKDLEFELLDKRLLKLETMMDETHKNEVTKNDIRTIHSDIENISTNIKDLKTKMNNMEYYKSDMYIFKNKLNQIEKKANKIDDLLLKYERMKKCAFYNKLCL